MKTRLAGSDMKHEEDIFISMSLFYLLTGNSG